MFKKYRTINWDLCLSDMTLRGITGAENLMLFFGLSLSPSPSPITQSLNQWLWVLMKWLREAAHLVERELQFCCIFRSEGLPDTLWNLKLFCSITSQKYLGGGKIVCE